MTKSLRRSGNSKFAGKRSRVKLFAVAVIAFIVIVLAYSAYSGSIAPSTKGPTSTILMNDSTAKIGLDVGNLAPAFQLKDIEGRTVTREALQGKPTMIFFTATWCVPCQVGAKELLKYYTETRGNAFNVLIVFVDPKETTDQIRQWKSDFGNSNWFTALDTAGMAGDYQVRYLDTKYVLASNGIIVWKDFYPLEYSTAKSVLGPLIG